MNEEIEPHNCAEAKEFTRSDMKRTVDEVMGPLQKQISELKTQNYKLKLAIRNIADAMMP